MTLPIKVKRLYRNAVLPKYATPGAACFDLAALTCGTEIVSAGKPVTVGTGLAFEIPEGHAMLIFSRSGHGFNFDVRLANCVGVIDSDYRGEVQVKLTSDSAAEMAIGNGARIAQAMIVELPKVQLVEVDSLSDTERGTGGFGSTGE